LMLLEKVLREGGREGGKIRWTFKARKGGGRAS